MRPKILDLLYRDDRMFVLELCVVNTSDLMSTDPPKDEWAVITRRNVPGYPPYRSDSFPTRADAVGFYNEIVVTTPLVSLGNKSPIPPPTLTEYKDWLIREKLYDPLLNPDSPVDQALQTGCEVPREDGENLRAQLD